MQQHSSGKAPQNLTQSLHESMVDEHSSTPFSKHYPIRSSSSGSTVRKSTNMLTEKDLGKNS